MQGALGFKCTNQTKALVEVLKEQSQGLGALKATNPRLCLEEGHPKQTNPCQGLNEGPAMKNPSRGMKPLK